MAMDAQMIVEMIRSGIPGAIVKIEDLRGDGEHYSAQVTSSTFKGLSRVQQHQMVYKALQGKMGVELHALAIHTSTPKD
ncbi:MAG TPA: BolA/IbaG family iron-sulfur metabolism protein [Micavibrio sp.]|nr:BolA/IbaG family iron-sulfur metabolism protein [Micavibrio sp.]